MSKSSPLTETEKQWLQNFLRKLDEMGSHQEYVTAFLDPRQLELAESALNKRQDFSYTVYGGHPGAERNALNIFSSHIQGGIPPVKAVLATWKSEEEISHRDFLGAVLALGLRRDQVGDILLLQDNSAAIMVNETKAEYVSQNLDQVGRINVSCTVIEPTQLPLAEDDGREIKGTVASLRVDAVLALGFGISRSKVVTLVKGGLVRVNWRPVNSPSLNLKEGDQLSLKGRGRVKISEVGGETRKGRMHVKLKKYS